MNCKIAEFIWPCLEPESEQEKQKDNEKLQSSIEEIESANWNDASPMLDEARILFDREYQRSKSAETKATVYLGVLAAVIPLAATILGQLTEFVDKSPTCISILLYILIILGTLYLISTGFWAFKVIKVQGYYRVDVPDFIKLQSLDDIQSALCKEILVGVRRNWKRTNDKTTYLKMAHEFILRAFIVFSLVILVMAILALISNF